MQDKTFLQAVRDRQNRLSDDFQSVLGQVLLRRTTVTVASENIQDEKMRTIVKDTLITGQMMALFKLMNELQILDDAHYDEFAEYLIQALPH